MSPIVPALRDEDPDADSRERRPPESDPSDGGSDDSVPHGPGSVDPATLGRRAVDPRAVERAAAVLARGGLVAVPTETVYGLAARADSPEAVARIYAAKGRPAHNPLIVHVPSTAAARALAADWPASAERLATALWPGPLTLVVRRADDRLAAVSAGRDTLAVRVSAHPVLLALLERSRLPLAAPSANPSNTVSPTRPEHVAAGLGDRVELILDAGPCAVGIESSVVDVTCDPPRLLRPGGVPLHVLRALAPDLVTAPPTLPTSGGHLSPGLDRRHYAPRARVELAARADLDAALAAAAPPVGLLTREPLERAPAGGGPTALHWSRALGPEPTAYAAGLFDALHAADAAGCATLVVERPPSDDAWAAVTDRLERAAAR